MVVVDGWEVVTAVGSVVSAVPLPVPEEPPDDPEVAESFAGGLAASGPERPGADVPDPPEDVSPPDGAGAPGPEAVPPSDWVTTWCTGATTVPSGAGASVGTGAGSGGDRGRGEIRSGRKRDGTTGQ